MLLPNLNGLDSSSSEGCCCKWQALSFQDGVIPPPPPNPDVKTQVKQDNVTFSPEGRLTVPKEFRTNWFGARFANWAHLFPDCYMLSSRVPHSLLTVLWIDFSVLWIHFSVLWIDFVNRKMSAKRGGNCSSFCAHFSIYKINSQILKINSQKLKINSQNREQTVRNSARKHITVGKKVRSIFLETQNVGQIN